MTSPCLYMIVHCVIVRLIVLISLDSFVSNFVHFVRFTWFDSPLHVQFTLLVFIANSVRNCSQAVSFELSLVRTVCLWASPRANSFHVNPVRNCSERLVPNSVRWELLARGLVRWHIQIFGFSLQDNKDVLLFIIHEFSYGSKCTCWVFLYSLLRFIRFSGTKKTTYAWEKGVAHSSHHLINYF